MRYYQISSGRGPVECEHAVMLLLQHFFSKKTITSDDVIEMTGDSNNPELLKSVYFKTDIDISKYIGTIKYVFKSKFRNTKRKNWFISVREIVPTVEFNKFDESKVVFSTMRSAGPGGQNVNKVETAVRAQYGNFVTVVRTERSQAQNKKLAVEKIKLHLLQVNEEQVEQDSQTKWSQHNNLERGNSVMTFNK